ncbi:MAG: RteC domain-containing protein [Saprospiraceae bacterium]|nr:RteC domain-containing protein [Saprospiraceae bacterium]
MLLKELHSVINAFEVFCNDVGHTSLLSLETIKQRKNFIVSQISKMVELENTFPFQSEAEEINYYRNERPKLFQYGIYYERLLDLESEKPIGKERKYYKELETSLHDDSKTIVEELKYYRLDNAEKDNIWFVKKSEKCNIFAVIKALYMLQKYLDNKLDSRQIEDKIADFRKLEWTGLQIEYVEELTSWKETKVINNGDVTLKELHERFQLFFEVNITDFDGTSHDIMERQDPARFCNKKAKALQDKQKRHRNKP